MSVQLPEGTTAEVEPGETDLDTLLERARRDLLERFADRVRKRQ